MYQTQIPNGYRPTSYIPPIPYFYQPSTGPTYLDGWIYNQFVAWLDKETYTCGGYQTLVIAFLDGIRTSPDENIARCWMGWITGQSSRWAATMRPSSFSLGHRLAKHRNGTRPLVQPEA